MADNRFDLEVGLSGASNAEAAINLLSQKIVAANQEVGKSTERASSEAQAGYRKIMSTVAGFTGATFTSGFRDQAQGVTREYEGLFKVINTVTGGVTALSTAIQTFGGMARSAIQTAVEAFNLLRREITDFGRDVLSATENIRTMEATFTGVFSSAALGKNIVGVLREMSEKIPLSVRAMGDVIKAVSIIPGLQPVLRDTEHLEANMTRMVRVVQGLMTLRPTLGIDSAVYAFREALTGTFLSLMRRFEVSPDLIAAAIGKTREQMRASGPVEIVAALEEFLKVNVGESAIETFIQQFSRRLEILKNIMENIRADIGQAGFYDTVVAQLNRVIATLIQFKDTTAYTQAVKEISTAFSGLVESVSASANQLMSIASGALFPGASGPETVLRAIGAGLDYVRERVRDFSEALAANKETWQSFFKDMVDAVKKLAEAIPHLIQSLARLAVALAGPAGSTIVTAAEHPFLATAATGLGSAFMGGLGFAAAGAAAGGAGRLFSRATPPPSPPGGPPLTAESVRRVLSLSEIEGGTLAENIASRETALGVLKTMTQKVQKGGGGGPATTGAFLDALGVVEKETVAWARAVQGRAALEGAITRQTEKIAKAKLAAEERLTNLAESQDIAARRDAIAVELRSHQVSATRATEIEQALTRRAAAQEELQIARERVAAETGSLTHAKVRESAERGASQQSAQRRRLAESITRLEENLELRLRSLPELPLSFEHLMGGASTASVRELLGKLGIQDRSRAVSGAMKQEIALPGLTFEQLGEAIRGPAGQPRAQARALLAERVQEASRRPEVQGALRTEEGQVLTRLRELLGQAQGKLQFMPESALGDVQSLLEQASREVPVTMTTNLLRQARMVTERFTQALSEANRRALSTATQEGQQGQQAARDLVTVAQEKLKQANENLRTVTKGANDEKIAALIQERMQLNKEARDRGTTAQLSRSSSRLDQLNAELEKLQNKRGELFQQEQTLQERATGGITGTLAGAPGDIKARGALGGAVAKGTEIGVGLAKEFGQALIMGAGFVAARKLSDSKVGEVAAGMTTGLFARITEGMSKFFPTVLAALTRGGAFLGMIGSMVGGLLSSVMATIGGGLAAFAAAPVAFPVALTAGVAAFIMGIATYIGKRMNDAKVETALELGQQTRELQEAGGPSAKLLAQIREGREKETSGEGSAQLLHLETQLMEARRRAAAQLAEARWQQNLPGTLPEETSRQVLAERQREQAIKRLADTTNRAQVELATLDKQLQATRDRVKDLTEASAQYGRALTLTDPAFARFNDMMARLIDTPATQLLEQTESFKTAFAQKSESLRDITDNMVAYIDKLLTELDKPLKTTGKGDSVPGPLAEARNQALALSKQGQQAILDLQKATLDVARVEMDYNRANAEGKRALIPKLLAAFAVLAEATENLKRVDVKMAELTLQTTLFGSLAAQFGTDAPEALQNFERAINDTSAYFSSALTALAGLSGLGAAIGALPPLNPAAFGLPPPTPPTPLTGVGPLLLGQERTTPGRGTGAGGPPPPSTPREILSKTELGQKFLLKIDELERGLGLKGGRGGGKDETEALILRYAPPAVKLREELKKLEAITIDHYQKIAGVKDGALLKEVTRSRVQEQIYQAEKKYLEEVSQSATLSLTIRGEAARQLGALEQKSAEATFQALRENRLEIEGTGAFAGATRRGFKTAAGGSLAAPGGRASRSTMTKLLQEAYEKATAALERGTPIPGAAEELGKSRALEMGLDKQKTLALDLPAERAKLAALKEQGAAARILLPIEQNIANLTRQHSHNLQAMASSSLAVLKAETRVAEEDYKIDKMRLKGNLTLEQRLGILQKLVQGAEALNKPLREQLDLIKEQARREEQRLRGRATTGMATFREPGMSRAARLQGLSEAERYLGETGEMAPEARMSAFQLGTLSVGARIGTRNQRMFQYGQQFAQNVRDSFAEGFETLFKGGSLKNVLRNFLNKFMSMIANQIADELTGNLFGGKQKGGGVVAGLVSTLAGGVAGKKQVSSRPDIIKLQHGGVVSRPTLAALAERGGPEAVVPLSGGRSIPVSLQKAPRERPKIEVNIYTTSRFDPDGFKAMVTDVVTREYVAGRVVEDADYGGPVRATVQKISGGG